MRGALAGDDTVREKNGSKMALMRARQVEFCRTVPRVRPNGAIGLTVRSGRQKTIRRRRHRSAADAHARFSIIQRAASGRFLSIVLEVDIGTAVSNSCTASTRSTLLVTRGGLSRT